MHCQHTVLIEYAIDIEPAVLLGSVFVATFGYLHVFFVLLSAIGSIDIVLVERDIKLRV